MNSDESLNKYEVQEAQFIEATYDTLNKYEKSRDSELLIGFIIWVLISLIMYVITVKIFYTWEESLWKLILVLLVSLIITNSITIRIQKKRIRNTLNKKNTRNKRKIKDEAESLTRNARNQIRKCYKDLEKLSEVSLKIDRLIQKAQLEFNDNMFSSYWHDIEVLISYFSEYDRNFRTFPNKREHYNNLLKDRKHNFPEFPTTQTILPDINSRLKEFRVVLKLGLTNYEFYSIYKKRKTHIVQVLNSENLEHTFNKIEANIHETLINLNYHFEKN